MSNNKASNNKDNEQYSISNKMPIGFGLSLAADEKAMAAFSKMSRQEKEQIIEESRSQHSKKDMKNFVQRLGQDRIF